MHMNKNLVDTILFRFDLFLSGISYSINSDFQPRVYDDVQVITML